ncbi:MAG: hypothetical protein QHH09_03835 [Microgenomates group bacterium]|nr:hypothetical protein [Microgenomates group bacterium]
MAVIVADPEGNVGITQSTINRLFRPIQPKNDPILGSGEFAFYLHQVP